MLDLFTILVRMVRFAELKGKATFEALFCVLQIASYSWLGYPLVMNYNYLNPLLLNYPTHFTLRRFCDAKFFQKQAA